LIVLALASILASVRDDWKLKKPKREPRPGDYCGGQLINSGGGYRIDDHQQIDFHVGVGLDRNAPAYIFGVGYSFRLDGVLRDHSSGSAPRPGFATR
jgi:hypothetical protein